VDAVRRLRRHGMKIALVSNAGADEVGAWPRSPFAPHFDAAVFSCDVGAVKPDPAIYEHALRAVGVAAEEAVFVGDGGSDEHRGARAVGLQPVIVTRYAAALWPEAVAARRVHADHAFEDVPEFVDRLLGRTGP
jgi:putative hydrolase of the HAD superfamily